MLNEEAMCGAIIGSAIRVHRELGPGLLESAYEACLAFELARQGQLVWRQRSMAFTYRGVELDRAYRLDLDVNETVIVEIKAVDCISQVHEAQLMTYLRSSGRCVGLLLNFNALRLRDGIVKRVMGFDRKDD